VVSTGRTESGKEVTVTTVTDKEYTLYLRWNRGDQMTRCLSECHDKVAPALRLRANEFREMAEVCDVVAKALEDSGKADTFQMQGGPYSVELNGPKDVLDKLEAHLVVWARRSRATTPCHSERHSCRSAAGSLSKASASRRPAKAGSSRQGANVF